MAINMDSTITRSVNDNINMDSTITGSVNDNINMDSTITGSVNDNMLSLRLYVSYTRSAVSLAHPQCIVIPDPACP